MINPKFLTDLARCIFRTSKTSDALSNSAILSASFQPTRNGNGPSCPVRQHLRFRVPNLGCSPDNLEKSPRRAGVFPARDARGLGSSSGSTRDATGRDSHRVFESREVWVALDSALGITTTRPSRTRPLRWNLNLELVPRRARWRIPKAMSSTR